MPAAVLGHKLCLPCGGLRARLEEVGAAVGLPWGYTAARIHSWEASKQGVLPTIPCLTWKKSLNYKFLVSGSEYTPRQNCKMFSVLLSLLSFNADPRRKQDLRQCPVESPKLLFFCELLCCHCVPSAHPTEKGVGGCKV